jgi:hypothetical protein
VEEIIEGLKRRFVMDWDKTIFSLAVAGIGAYAVYQKEAAIAGTCLGIMGAILRPGQEVPQGTKLTVEKSPVPEIPNAPPE